jgi:hypothetical protein
MRLLGAVALVVALSPCSDVERYPAGPAPLDTPERITDASLVFDPASGHAVLTWTAPRASDEAESLVRYEIRYAYDNEFDWPTALSVLDPPAPSPHGRAQEYRFEHPEQGGRLNAAIVSIDDADNSSPQSDVVALTVPGLRFAGRVIHALTQQPIAGIDVEVTGSTISTILTTDASGDIELTDLRPQEITVSIKTDPASPQFFDVVQDIVCSTDIYQWFVLIPYANTELYPSMSVLTLLKTAVETNSSTTSDLRIWTSHPIPLHIPEYTNEHGIDYQQIAVDAALRWMEVTGITIWELVDQPSPWGVTIAYKTPQEMGIQIGITHHTNDPDGFPLRSDIDIVNTFADSVKVWRTMLHELGHTIRLAHLPRGYLMFASVPLPDDPTNDEILIVRLIHGLANPTDMTIYREVGR